MHVGKASGHLILEKTSTVYKQEGREVFPPFQKYGLKFICEGGGEKSNYLLLKEKEDPKSTSFLKT